MQSVFAPGCALLMYKPHLAEKLNAMLSENLGKMDDLLFGEETHPGTWEPDQWHQELDEFIRVH